jgi:hypothetical protein
LGQRLIYKTGRKSAVKQDIPEVERVESRAHVMYELPRPHRLFWAYETMAGWTDDEWRELAPMLWMDAEPGGRQRGAWLTLLRIAHDRVGLLRDEQGEQLPEGDVEIYRGVSGAPRPGCRSGLSWTLDIERARWFAIRFAVVHGNPRVYSATVDSQAVLAFLTGRHEREVVVDPHDLRRVRLLERFPEKQTQSGFAPGT